MQSEATSNTDQLLSVLREYAKKLEEHSADFSEMRWNFFIRIAAFVSFGAFVLLGVSYGQSQRLYALSQPELGGIIIVSFAFVGIFLAVQFFRSYSRLGTQVRSELYLCKRLVSRASEILEQSDLTAQNRFVFEVSLYEAERAVNEAEAELRRALFGTSRTNESPMKFKDDREYRDNR